MSVNNWMRLLWAFVSKEDLWQQKRKPSSKDQINRPLSIGSIFSLQTNFCTELIRTRGRLAIGDSLFSFHFCRTRGVKSRYTRSPLAIYTMSLWAFFLIPDSKNLCLSLSLWDKKNPGGKKKSTAQRFNFEHSGLFEHFSSFDASGSNLARPPFFVSFSICFWASKLSEIIRAGGRKGKEKRNRLGKYRHVCGEKSV